MSKLNSVTIRGYRSIKDATLELRPLNVLIGANGAGKSNLVSFFKMMNELMAGRLQQYIAVTGHATSNLYFGPGVTPQLEAALEFETDTNDVDTYRMRLFHAAGDSLIFAEECLSFRRSGFANSRDEQLGAGHKETLIGSTAEGDGPSAPTARVFRYLLNGCRVFHFHDTGPASRVRSYCYVGADRWLMPDAGNLAAVLYRLGSDNPDTYHSIVETIRQVAPFFTGFDLEPTGAGGKDIILNWRHRDSDLIFGPHQLSDGTLRAICLISLLMLPADELPLVIVIDEPELGLNPYALDILASLCRSASVNSQILISTQSGALVNKFEPRDIVVVKRDGESSGIVRPDAGDLESWLEDYSLGEFWEKNVIGGGPHWREAPPSPLLRTASDVVMGARASSPRAVHAGETHSPWHSRGYLPHFEGGEIVQSITFRLHDSLPLSLRDRFAAELECLAGNERKLHQRRRIEAALDRGHGACYLANPRIARLVSDALRRFDGERYRLHAWCVMPNHVHVVATPCAGWTLSSIVHAWKSFTGTEANRHLGRRGRFWMQEYFDRAIRDERHFRTVVEYVERNPVKAGLCETPEDWPWSSIGVRYSGKRDSAAP